MKTYNLSVKGIRQMIEADTKVCYFDCKTSFKAKLKDIKDRELENKLTIFHKGLKTWLIVNIDHWCIMDFDGII